MISLVFRNLSTQDKVAFVVLFPVTLISSIWSLTAPVSKMRRGVKNWIDVFMVTRGMRESAQLTLCDGEKFEFTKAKHVALNHLLDFLLIPEDAKRKFHVKLDGEMASMAIRGHRLVVDKEICSTLVGELVEQTHDVIDVKGKTVIDVGAYWGDSAVYYLLERGAKKVYGYELDRNRYELGNRMIKSNGLQDRIKLLNIGVVGGESQDRSAPNSIMIAEQENCVMKTLDDVARSADGKELALKIDIEGAEYEVLDGTPSNTLKKFDAIHVEYHYGYRTIVERLRKEGFKVSYTKPHFHINFFSWAGITASGNIMAVRKGQTA